MSRQVTRKARSVRTRKAKSTAKNRSDAGRLVTGDQEIAVRGPGRPGGAESRSRILDEAGQLFARDGFEGVTIRRIAARAEVNLAAVGYHFGGKKGLYHEVMCQIIRDVAPIIAPVVENIQGGVAAATGNPKALSLLAAQFVRHTLTAVLTNEPLRWQQALLVREFSQPSEEFPMILAESISPMHDAVGQLVAAAMGKGSVDSEVRLLTTNVVGQCMIYQIARTLVCARMGWVDYTPENVERLIAMVTGSVQRTLGLPETGPAPEPGTVTPR